jgi:hypothetical protein
MLSVKSYFFPRVFVSSLISLTAALVPNQMPAFSQERVLLDNLTTDTASNIGTFYSSRTDRRFNETAKSLVFTTGTQGFQLTQLGVALERTSPIFNPGDTLDAEDIIKNGTNARGDNSLPWKFSVGLWSHDSTTIPPSGSPTTSLLASQSVEIFLDLRPPSTNIYTIPISAPGFILNPNRSYGIGLFGMQQPGDNPLVTRGFTWRPPALSCLNSQPPVCGPDAAPLGYEGIAFNGAWRFQPSDFPSLPLGNDWRSSSVWNSIRLMGVPLEAPGSSPVNPLLPAPPPSANSPWIFPPVTISDPNDVIWFDPEVAIGYIFNISDLSGPLFDQFTAPDLLFNDTYQLLGTSSSSCSVDPSDYNSPIATVTQGIAYDFTTPLPCFAIKGIDPANALDPLNAQAFVSGISFDKTGSVSVTQTPIPTPGPVSLLGVAALFHRARVLRGRVRSAKRTTNQVPSQ